VLAAASAAEVHASAFRDGHPNKRPGLELVKAPNDRSGRPERRQIAGRNPCTCTVSRR